MINSQELWEKLFTACMSHHLSPLSLFPYASHNPLGARRTDFNFPLQSGGRSLSLPSAPAHVITSSCLKWHSFSLFPLWSRYRVDVMKHSLEEEVKSIQRINILKILSSWHRSLYIISSPLGSIGMNLTVFQVRKLFKPSFTLTFSWVFPYLKLLLACGRPSKLGGHPLI